MNPYHVKSGQLDVVIVAEDAEEAARAAIAGYFVKGMLLGLLLSVEGPDKEPLYVMTKGRLK